MSDDKVENSASRRDGDSEGNEANDRIEKPRDWFQSLTSAFEGVLYAFKTQSHIRVHYTLAVLILGVSLLLDLTYTEFMLFALSVLMLLASEMFNSAIIDLANLVERRFEDKVKRVKDVSAGGVLVSSFGFLIMGYVLVTKYMEEPFTVAVTSVKNDYGFVVGITFLVVLVVVVGLKYLLSEREGLKKATPSMHSALAFSLWTALSLITADVLVGLLTFIMALMICHSRLLVGVIGGLNVFTGALAGIGVTIIVFYVSGLAL